MVNGCDVSAYQGKIDWEKVKRAGIDYCFAKATEGMWLIDHQFTANRAAAKAAGLLVGGYHFFRPAEDPRKQAEHFLAVAKPEKGELPPVCDVEKPGLSPGLYERALLVFLHAVEVGAGIRPLIYTSPGLWNSLVSGNFSQYYLWVAEYTSAPEPRLPTDWTAWRFWQRSSSGNIPGIAGHVDLDVYNGDLAELQSLCLK